MSKRDIKQPNICLYSSGRSGSNYLLQYLQSDARYVSMGEPFTLDNVWNRSIFLENCGRLLRSKKINKEQYLHILKSCCSSHSVCSIKKVIKIENLLSMLIDVEKSKNVSKGINTKVQWDKQKYIGFATEAKNTHNKAIQHFVQFDGPKAMICYEEISENNKNTIAFLNKTLEISKIDCHMGTPQLPIKQSSDISLEHNFTNPEEFLQDINTINDFIFLRKPDGI